MKHEIYTFRARTLADALGAVREQLGPDAAVLETRRLGAPLLGLLGGSTVEVTASTGIDVPSRLPSAGSVPKATSRAMQRAELEDYRQKIQRSLATVARHEVSLVERLAAASRQEP
jgi:flagellar biosynthesis GTPase FlhF